MSERAGPGDTNACNNNLILDFDIPRWPLSTFIIEWLQFMWDDIMMELR